MFSIIQNYWGQWLSGLELTVALLLVSLILGLLLSLLVTFCRLSFHAVVRVMAEGYCSLIRGTPLLVQLFLIYYGSGQLHWLKATPLWDILQSPFACVLLALVINTSAYTSEIFKGAIKFIDLDQVYASYSLGLSVFQAQFWVLLPLALRQVLPAYSNEVVMMLKNTSLASTVTLLDVLGTAKELMSQTYQTLPCLFIAALIYGGLNVFLIALFRYLERRYAVLI